MNTHIVDPRVGHGAWRFDPVVLRHMSRHGRTRIRVRTIDPARPPGPPGPSGIPWVRALQEAGHGP